MLLVGYYHVCFFDKSGFLNKTNGTSRKGFVKILSVSRDSFLDHGIPLIAMELVFCLCLRCVDNDGFVFL